MAGNSHRWRTAVLLTTSVASLVAGFALIAPRPVSEVVAQSPDVTPFRTKARALPPDTGPTESSQTTGCNRGPGANEVTIPDLCIHGPVVPTPREPDGDLVIPASATEVGLWDGGATVGAAEGTTLLAGHVVYGSAGKGTLFDLHKVAPGTVVELGDATGRVTRWRVIALEQVIKAALPSAVFRGRAGPRRLVLVTCGGPVVEVPGHGPTYRDNVIVTAVPARPAQVTS